jgi:hypothetical protein
MKKGFTLLEVLVAMVILFTTIIVVFQVISQGFGTLARMSDYQDLYLSLTNLMDDIDRIHDFETNMERKGAVGRFEYDWKASPVSEKQRVPGFDAMPLPWEIRLYKIDLRVYFGAKDDSRKYRDYAFYKMGWLGVAK